MKSSTRLLGEWPICPARDPCEGNPARDPGAVGGVLRCAQGWTPAHAWDTDFVHFHSGWNNINGVTLGPVPASRLIALGGAFVSPRGVPTEMLGTGPSMSPWVELGPLDEMPDVARGRSCCAVSVCQSRRVGLKIIPSVVAAPCARLTNTHSAAFSQSWMGGGLPKPCVRFRARVMRGIISAHFPPPILYHCFPQNLRAK